MTDELPAPIRDDRTEAIIALSWLIVLNKPFYPLYVWYLTGEGVLWSCLSTVAMPAYLAIAMLARRNSRAARIAFPIVALADTLAETKLFGAASATELFLAPAALITALAFRPSEARIPRVLSVSLYVALIALHGRLGEPLYHWSDTNLAHLRELNIFAVASLTVFTIWRFSGCRDSERRASTGKK